MSLMSWWTDSNMLDLWVYMVGQSDVEDKHRMKTMYINALSNSIGTYFWNFNMDTLERIRERWIRVLYSMTKCDGDDDIVEEFRGKKNVVILPSDDEEMLNNEREEDETGGETIITSGDNDSMNDNGYDHDPYNNYEEI